jgi:hypothetical protein
MRHMRTMKHISQSLLIHMYLLWASTVGFIMPPQRGSPPRPSPSPAVTAARRHSLPPSKPFPTGDSALPPSHRRPHPSPFPTVAWHIHSAHLHPIGDRALPHRGMAHPLTHRRPCPSPPDPAWRIHSAHRITHRRRPHPPHRAPTVPLPPAPHPARFPSSRTAATSRCVSSSLSPLPFPTSRLPNPCASSQRRW